MNAGRFWRPRRWLRQLVAGDADESAARAERERVVALLAPLSHDLRSAPGTILSLCEADGAAGGENVSEARWREEVARQARRGLAGADRLLALLRASLPEAAERVPLGLPSLLDEALDDLSERTGRPVDMEVSGDEALVVAGDFMLLRQAFTELLLLAAGSTGAGEALSLSCGPEGKEARCSIRAPGASARDPGFREWRPEHREPLAAPQVPLTLAALILRRHGGDLEVVPGTVTPVQLCIRLPLASAVP